MFLTVRLNNASTTGLLVLLLASSASVMAKAPEVAASESVAEKAVGEKQQQVHHYPQWPERKHEVREVVPPPPPGPYMSSALSGHSVKGPTFANKVKKRSMAFDSSNVSMDTFSPDIPWPTNTKSNMKSPSRWVPEKGYRYVEPQAQARSRVQPYPNVPPTSNRFNYQPRSGPAMNWSGMPFGNNMHHNNRHQTRPYQGSANASPKQGQRPAPRQNYYPR